MQDVQLLTSYLHPQAALRTFSKACGEAGAIASFIGKVRPGGGVTKLEISHYGPLTLPGIEELAEQAMVRFDLEGVLAHHRIGEMQAGDPIVLVAAASRHRRKAFEAADFMMDHLKSAAWLWKRERRGGEWRWIEPRDADRIDLARWA